MSPNLEKNELGFVDFTRPLENGAHASSALMVGTLKSRMQVLAF